MEYSRQTGLTLVELLTVIAILGALAAIALPNYRAYVERTLQHQAIQDLAALDMAIGRYFTEQGTYPGSLDELGGAPPLTDPWGNPYQYLAIDVEPPPNKGQVRRDKNLNPLNSDFDLYSMGPDGQTQKQLTAAQARDDVVRAGNGGYLGLASEH